MPDRLHPQLPQCARSRHGGNHPRFWFLLNASSTNQERMMNIPIYAGATRYILVNGKRIISPVDIDGETP
jgi:hypothetical protein